MQSAIDPIRRINERFEWTSSFEYLFEWVQSCVWMSLPINKSSPISCDESELNYRGALLEFDRNTQRFALHKTDEDGTYYIVSFNSTGYFVEGYGCEQEDVERNVVFDVLELEYVAGKIATDISFWVGKVVDIYEQLESGSKSEEIMKH